MTEMAEIPKFIWMFIILLAGSISDIRKQSVSVFYLTVSALGCIIVSVPGFEADLHLPGLLPGLILLLFSRMFPGVMGEGDAIAVCFIGFTFGLYAAATVLMITLLLISIYAQALIFMKKAGRNSRAPLYPFLCLSYSLRLLFVMKGGS